MLLVRPPTSIFQQIILPYLSTTATAYRRVSKTATNTSYSPGSRCRQRVFGTSATYNRPPDASGETSFGQSVGWEPYEPHASSSRRRTREYLGLDDACRIKQSAGEHEEDAYMRTTALALDRIIRSHSPTSLSVKGKGKGKEVDRTTGTESSSRPTLSTLDSASSTSSSRLHTHPIIEEVSASRTRSLSMTSDISTPALDIIDRPFPPLIHQLLQARQFRLTTLHILNYPSHALDQSLVSRVAGYMDRHGGQAAARRLRKGKIPSPQDRDALSHIQDVLPTSAYPFSPSDMNDRMPGISEILAPQARLTAFYNTQLARQLSSSSTAKGYCPPKSFPLPNTSLRQLRALLSRIHNLEQTNDFVPDRVTANLVLSCWMRSALAPPPDGVRVVQTRDKKWTSSPRHTGRNQNRFETEEMRRLFRLVSRLFDRSARPISTPTMAVSATSDGIETKADSDARTTNELADITTRERATAEGGGDPGLSYSRHVKPFVRIFRHGFKQRQDRVGLDQLREWDERIKVDLSKRRCGAEPPPSTHLDMDKT